MNCDMCKVIEQIKNGEKQWFVKELETGYVILGWNQHFYGYSLFICKKHVVELFDLDIDFRTKYLQEMVIVAEAVKKVFKAENKNNNRVRIVFLQCEPEIFSLKTHLIRKTYPRIFR